MSYGIAFSRWLAARTARAGTKRKSGVGSMKRLMSHGHAMRSTRARSRVIHFMMSLLSQREDDEVARGTLHVRIGADAIEPGTRDDDERVDGQEDPDRD